MNTNIFKTENDESPVQIIRKTMSVSLNDDGVAIVSFAMNRGKGTGAQAMPVAQFRDYVDTLSSYVEDGIPEVADEDLTAAECLKRSIRQEDGILSFRVRSGKGAKPAKIPADSLGSVADLLASTVDAVEGAAQSLL